jgi:hypothetical protein
VIVIFLVLFLSWLILQLGVPPLRPGHGSLSFLPCDDIVEFRKPGAFAYIIHSGQLLFVFISAVLCFASIVRSILERCLGGMEEPTGWNPSE